jgi:hypothetical protein
MAPQPKRVALTRIYTNITHVRVHAHAHDTHARAHAHTRTTRARAHVHGRLKAATDEAGWSLAATGKHGCFFLDSPAVTPLLDRKAAPHAAHSVQSDLSALGRLQLLKRARSRGIDTSAIVRRSGLGQCSFCLAGGLWLGLGLGLSYSKAT